MDDLYIAIIDAHSTVYNYVLWYTVNFHALNQTIEGLKVCYYYSTFEDGFCLASILTSTHKLDDSTKDVHSIYVYGFNFEIKVEFERTIPVLKRLNSSFWLLQNIEDIK